jgi:glycosyltransferase involved in cell wall biosynthesis
MNSNYIPNNMITKNLILYKEPKLTLITNLKRSVNTADNVKGNQKNILEVLFITTFPPKECGIATFTQDLILSIQKGFGSTFHISICALDSYNEEHQYSKQIKYKLNTDEIDSYNQLAENINADTNIKMVILEHEFGLFGQNGKELKDLLHNINKPISIAFHTVLPQPGELFKTHVKALAAMADSVIVMTRTSYNILVKEYHIKKSKITVIPHGTHLVKHGDKEILKAKYGLKGKNVLSTFGFLGSGKSIETTLDAMPAIVAHDPETIFLIIGKTHPSTLKREGEFYRDFLNEKVNKLGLQANVLFVNAFLPLHELLEYLQLTDVYLFTSKDPNQAVSGTFAYAISCGCPIISTPIPHAKEVLMDDAGIIIDFKCPEQLSAAVIRLLDDVQYRNELGLNGLHRMASTAWENSAIAHAILISEMTNNDIRLLFKIPEINLYHIKKLTTDVGMIQFSRINIPDKTTGYTLDDNARAMVAICQHYTLSGDEDDKKLIRIYHNFIRACLQKDGNFLNYVDTDLRFTSQNFQTNLDDSNGRAIWALGFLISKCNLLPTDILNNAIEDFDKALQHAENIHSTRAMAFIIKGLYFASLKSRKERYLDIINILGQRLLKMYDHESEINWQWYESYLTYGNSIIPEAMLCASLVTGNTRFKDVAKLTFDFLLSKTFKGDRMQVISNQTWMHKGDEIKAKVTGGEQPIDVAYTILALKRFSEIFEDNEYNDKMKHAFNWFLGENHLQQIIYNPCTGGCYDGLEKHNVNLNQGAESTVSYLMARLTVDKI